jgi:hypothetical protein
VFLDKIVESKDSNDFSSSNPTLSRKDLEKRVQNWFLDSEPYPVSG